MIYKFVSRIFFRGLKEILRLKMRIGILMVLSLFVLIGCATAPKKPVTIEKGIDEHTHPRCGHSIHSIHDLQASTRSQGVHNIHSRCSERWQHTPDEAHDQGKTEPLPNNAKGEGEVKGEFGKGLKIHRGDREKL